jgi:hypothetical protein
VSLTAGGPAGNSAPFIASVYVGANGCSVEGRPDANQAAAVGTLAAALLVAMVTVNRRRRGA